MCVDIELGLHSCTHSADLKSPRRPHAFQWSSLELSEQQRCCWSFQCKHSTQLQNYFESRCESGDSTSNSDGVAHAETPHPARLVAAFHTWTHTFAPVTISIPGRYTLGKMARQSLHQQPGDWIQVIAWRRLSRDPFEGCLLWLHNVWHPAAGCCTAESAGTSIWPFNLFHPISCGDNLLWHACASSHKLANLSIHSVFNIILCS